MSRTRRQRGRFGGWKAHRTLAFHFDGLPPNCAVQDLILVKTNRSIECEASIVHEMGDDRTHPG
jgi:hypothetical protein